MDNTSSSKAANSGSPSLIKPSSETASPGTAQSGAGSSAPANSGNRQGGSWSPVWYGIAGLVFVAVLAVLFMAFSSRTLRHRYDSSPQPGGVGQTHSPAPVVPD